MKIGVIYWSGTGNTEMMANAVADGARAAGAEVDVMTVSETDAAGAPFPMTPWPWDARPWERSSWRRASLSPSSPSWKAASAERRWPCSVPTSGCEEGQWMDEWDGEGRWETARFSAAEWDLRFIPLPMRTAWEKCRELGKALASM